MIYIYRDYTHRTVVGPCFSFSYHKFLSVIAFFRTIISVQFRFRTTRKFTYRFAIPRFYNGILHRILLCSRVWGDFVPFDFLTKKHIMVWGDRFVLPYTRVFVLKHAKKVVRRSPIRVRKISRYRCIDGTGSITELPTH